MKKITVEQLATILKSSVEQQGYIFIIDIEDSFRWSAETEKEYCKAAKSIDKIIAKGYKWKLYCWYDTSGFEYWMKKQREANYIQITVILETDKLTQKQADKIILAVEKAKRKAEQIENEYSYPNY